MYFRVLAAAAFLLPVSGNAQSLDPTSPAQIMQALQDFGYSASYDPYASGRPRVRSAIEGIDYVIGFYNCRSDFTDCGSLLFVKGYDLPSGLDFKTLNDWNSTKLIGRVYLDDENDPFIDYFVDAEFGIAQQTFEDIVEGWGRTLVSFEETIGWN